MVNKTLSDKRKNYYGDSWDYPEKDIKEFIKELKESEVPFQWISGGCDEESCKEEWREYIDKLAGDELK